MQADQNQANDYSQEEVVQSDRKGKCKQRGEGKRKGNDNDDGNISMKRRVWMINATLLGGGRHFCLEL